jgi:hypothetical protein
MHLSSVIDIHIELSSEEVWRCLGPSGAAQQGLADDVSGAAEEASSLCTARGSVRTLAVTGREAGRVVFEGGIVIEGRLLPHLFEGADGGVFLLATAGPGIEGRVRELFAADDPVAAIVMDAAGSAAARNAFAQLVAMAATSLHTQRFQMGPCVKPGTGVWDIEGQRALFRVAPAAEVGVRLLDSLLMEPQKSQSGVIPFGQSLRVLHDPEASPCRSCSARRCPMRREVYKGPVA